jgi:hypothetical protein
LNTEERRNRRNFDRLISLSPDPRASAFIRGRFFYFRSRAPVVHSLNSLAQARAPAVHGLLFLLRSSLLRKLIFKLRHSDFSAAEFHAFHLEAKTLVKTAFAEDRNASPGGDNAVPGKTVRLAQCADHKARASGNPGCAGDSSIGGNVAARDIQDRRTDTLKFRVWLLRFSHHHILNRVKTQRQARTQKFSA